MTLKKPDTLDLINISEEEFDSKYNDLLELNEWYRNVKQAFLSAVLEGGMMPGDYPIKLSTSYVDLTAIYPKQDISYTIDTDQMKDTMIQVIDDMTGEVGEPVNAYDYFLTKPKKPSKAYVKETKKG